MRRKKSVMKKGDRIRSLKQEIMQEEKEET